MLDSLKKVRFFVVFFLRVSKDFSVSVYSGSFKRCRSRIELKQLKRKVGVFFSLCWLDCSRRQEWLPEEMSHFRCSVS